MSQVTEKSSVNGSPGDNGEGNPQNGGQEMVKMVLVFFFSLRIRLHHLFFFFFKVCFLVRKIGPELKSVANPPPFFSSPKPPSA